MDDSWGTVIGIACLIGYVLNFIAFVNLDFQEPYRAEVLRGIGLVVVPLGVVEGFIPIND